MAKRGEVKTSRKKKSEELDITGFKLLPSAKPPLFHGYTVRKTVSSYFWGKKLRPFILEQQGKKCAVCGWTPKHETEMKRLHLHEIEKYDFDNKVCHLIDIQLICWKCHSFQHIVRTKSVSTKEQWEDLMLHFIRVNGCPAEIVNQFDLVVTKALQQEDNSGKPLEARSLEEIFKLAKKPAKFTIHPSIPFAEELKKQIEKKGLLYEFEQQE
ncbi:hypothetical protein M3221_11980 [Domibacillus indicus]|uniref:hypothetical protein n=1 Tax=Domibacillus indicus TaxID=1437523 RepID=UPI0020411D30|nr:hypothetical protein [Domibacillus indicus]MCM3789124.1 hypothetical protein [Domibacillus indicus]